MSDLQDTVYKSNNNFIMFFRDYYKIESSNYLHFKGNRKHGDFHKGNKLFISSSAIKPIYYMSYLDDSEISNRIIDISNFYILTCSNLCLTNGSKHNNNNNNLIEIEKSSGGTIKTKFIQGSLFDNLYIINSEATYGGAIAQFNEYDDRATTVIRECLFSGCKAYNLGGVYFNFLYKGNKGFNTEQFNNFDIKGKDPYNILILNSNIFNNSSSLNRGGAVFNYYNTNTFLNNNEFYSCNAYYGDDIYISDQSSIKFTSTKSKAFIEGSTNSKVTGTPHSIFLFRYASAIGKV